MSIPTLPARAAYVHLSNPAKRNALSLSVLRDLRFQLLAHNTSPSGKLLLLPPFKPGVISSLTYDQSFPWLVDAEVWRREREGLPNVIVLRSEGPVFSSGHDLAELRKLSHDEVKETFTICAEVMSLIRRSPAPVMCPIQGIFPVEIQSLDRSAIENLNNIYRVGDRGWFPTRNVDRLSNCTGKHAIPAPRGINRPPMYFTIDSSSTSLAPSSYISPSRYRRTNPRQRYARRS